VAGTRTQAAGGAIPEVYFSYDPGTDWERTTPFQRTASALCLGESNSRVNRCRDWRTPLFMDSRDAVVPYMCGVPSSPEGLVPPMHRRGSWLYPPLGPYVTPI